MNIENIDTLISKFVNGTSSHSENKELTTWIKESEENKMYYLEQQKLYALSTKSTPIFNADEALEKAKKGMGFSKGGTRKLYITISAVAASLLLLVGMQYMFNSQSSIEIETTYASTIEKNTQTLYDGSIVDIDKESSLAVYERVDSIRSFMLNGRAYFDVEPMPEKPFVVTVDFVEVRVLGTQFEIFQNKADSSIIVSVIEGKVQVTNTLTGEKNILVKGERSIANKTHLQKKIIESNNFLAWKTGVLDFEETALEEAIIDINEYYKSSIVLASDSLENCLVTVRLDNKSFSDVKAILELVLNAQFEDTNSTVVLKAKPCN